VVSQIGFERAVLGRTGIEAGRLGISASYGMPASAVERAVGSGLNYAYWGSMRRDAFADGLRRVKRDRYTLVLQSYSRFGGLVRWSVERALRKLGTDHADVLLLGMWNKPVWNGVLEAALRLKEAGLARALALSTHHRPLAPRVAAADVFDIVHVRYNAVHTGAERDLFPLLPAANRPGIVSFTATSWRQLLGHRRIPKNEKAPSAGDCYRFVLSNPDVDVCLTGLGSDAHLDHALEALRRGPMAAEEMAWMRRVGRAIYGK
jgi:aryl-alcohol dehydrogenase-like predicted oxidoreductase